MGTISDNKTINDDTTNKNIEYIDFVRMNYQNG